MKKETMTIEKIKSLLNNDRIISLRVLRDTIESETRLFLTQTLDEILRNKYYTFSNTFNNFTLTITIYLDDSYEVKMCEPKVDTLIKIKSIVIVII